MGKGMIEPVYRPKKDQMVTVDEYIPCKYCLGWYGKSDLWRHVKECELNTNKEGPRQKPVASGKLLKSVPATISDEKFRSVIDGLAEDDVSLLIKNDSLLCLYGQKLTMSVCGDKVKYDTVREKLRQLARLLIILREQQNKPDLSAKEIVNPTMFLPIMQACRVLCGFDDDKGVFGKPSTALKIGPNIKHMVNAHECNQISLGDRASREQCDDLRRLFDLRWSQEFSSFAHHTVTQRLKHTIKPVPLTADKHI